MVARMRQARLHVCMGLVFSVTRSGVEKPRLSGQGFSLLHRVVGSSFLTPMVSMTLGTSRRSGKNGRESMQSWGCGIYLHPGCLGCAGGLTRPCREFSGRLWEGSSLTPSVAFGWSKEVCFPSGCRLGGSTSGKVNSMGGYSFHKHPFVWSRCGPAMRGVFRIFFGLGSCGGFFVAVAACSESDGLLPARW